VARTGERRGLYRILVDKFERKSLLGRLVDRNKMGLQEVG